MPKGTIPKTSREIEIMKEGGKKLAEIKRALAQAVDEGVTAAEIEELANDLIEKTGGRASFKMVEGYSWATCINVNEGVVHGIPSKTLVFKKGDIVSVDVGLYYRGFHTDTSFTVGVGVSGAKQRFLEAGREALYKAISQVRVGKRVYDISFAIQKTLEKRGLSPVRSLVGHGIGKKLHEEPYIPCFVTGKKEDTPVIPEGAVLAIEVMYTEGLPDLTLAEDGWTIKTKDGKIAGLFEETVAATYGGPLVLTNPDLGRLRAKN